MTRIYGARALAMGGAFLTSGASERARWRRLSLAIDVCDTATGVNHLIRRDASARATIAMIALTATYALCGAAAHLRANDRLS